MLFEDPSQAQDDRLPHSGEKPLVMLNGCDLCAPERFQREGSEASSPDSLTNTRFTDRVGCPCYLKILRCTQDDRLRADRIQEAQLSFGWRLNSAQAFPFTLNPTCDL